MRILHITTHLNKGGITSYLSSLAEGLIKKGHDIFIASSGGEDEGEFLNNNIKLINIPIRTKKEISPSVLFSYFALRRFLSRNNIDIIHAHTRVTQVLASLLSRKFRIPLVTTCHGFFNPRWHRKKFPCWGHKTIAISRQVKKHLISEFKLSEENICLVHNGVDMDKIRVLSSEEIYKLKEEIGIEKETFVVGTAARFSSVKGLEYLVRALPEVLKTVSNVALLLIGYGKEEPKLKQIAKDLNIESKVIFFNPKKETHEYLCVMNIFVMPSIQEGLGISILEAQANKIPVIASNVGGIPDIIEDRQTGILVESKRESSIAKAILELIQNKNLYEKIRASAYEGVSSKFTLGQMVTKTEKVYIRSNYDF